MWWYGVALIFGVALIVAAVYTLKVTFDFLKTGETTLATVIEIQRTEDSDGDSFRSIFRYTTKANREITYEQTGTSNSPRHWVGQQFTIVYDPAEPMHSRQVTYWGMFGLPLVLLITGLPLSLLGAGYYLSQRFLDHLIISSPAQ